MSGTIADHRIDTDNTSHNAVHNAVKGFNHGIQRKIRPPYHVNRFKPPLVLHHKAQHNIIAPAPHVPECKFLDPVHFRCFHGSGVFKGINGPLKLLNIAFIDLGLHLRGDCLQIRYIF